MPRIKIATFNVNGIRSRLAPLLQWLAKEQPDVACLQELKAPDAAFPIAAIRDAGYGAVWQGQASWNGVAILSKGSDPVESRRGLPGDPSDTHSRYLEAAAHGLIVGCLYLPNGNPQPGPKFAYKLAWFERLIRHASKLYACGHPVVLAGDYNVVPTDELDIYNPKSWRKDALLQPESRACYARLLEQGWTDALRATHPGEQVFTFWDYFRKHWERNAGLRIDHLLLNAELAPRLHSAGVDDWVRALPGASDHAPTWIELDGVGRATRKAATKSVAKPATAAKRATRNSTPREAAAKTSTKRTNATANSTPAATKAAARTPPDGAAAKKTSNAKKSSLRKRNSAT